MQWPLLYNNKHRRSKYLEFVVFIVNFAPQVSWVGSVHTYIRKVLHTIDL